MSRPRRATAADVAEEAGVSSATVSYVLNQTPGQKISETTAARVHDAAQRLGYVTNSAARALARGESSFVIVDMSLFPRSEITDAGFHQLTEYLELRGYTTLLTWWGPEDWEQHLVKLAIETSASRVITSVPVSEETHGALRTAGVKTISSLLATQEELAIPLQLAATEQVRYLAANGHCHLLYVPEIETEFAEPSSLRETEGGRAAAELGLCWNSVQGSSTAEEYFVNIEEALTLYPETSALVTYNDHVALGTLSALQALETPVPERVSLIGVGNLAFTEATYPPLTTVKYSYVTEAVTSEAVDGLVEGDGRNGVVSNILEAIDVAVVERASVASPCGSALRKSPHYLSAN